MLLSDLLLSFSLDLLARVESLLINVVWAEGRVSNRFNEVDHFLARNISFL